MLHLCCFQKISFIILGSSSNATDIQKSNFFSTDLFFYISILSSIHYLKIAKTSKLIFLWSFTFFQICEKFTLPEIVRKICFSVWKLGKYMLMLNQSSTWLPCTYPNRISLNNLAFVDNFNIRLYRFSHGPLSTYLYRLCITTGGVQLGG